MVSIRKLYSIKSIVLHLMVIYFLSSSPSYAANADAAASTTAGEASASESQPRSPRTLKKSPSSDHLSLYHNIPTPVLRSPTYNQVIELYTIFVFLYAYATQIDFGGEEFFGRKSAEQLILDNINTLSLLLIHGNFLANANRIFGITYEAIQLFDLVVCLFLESDLVDAPQPRNEALAIAFESSRNTHPHTTIAEEWVLKFIKTQYESSKADPLASPYLTKQVLDIALNLNRKLLQKLHSNYPHFAPLITDYVLLREYDAFLQTQAGRRNGKEIAKTGIIHPLEVHHGCLMMKATRKSICLQQDIMRDQSYKACDPHWLTKMREIIAELIDKRKIPHQEIFQIVMKETQTKHPPLLKEVLI